MKNIELPTVADLEAMTTHQLADLLANFVLLLRRLPDVRFGQLQMEPTPPQAAEVSEAQKNSQGMNWVDVANNRVNGPQMPEWLNQTH